MFIMGQTSRCCMVCLMPLSQVSVSFEYPHVDVFTLVRQTCTQPVQCLLGCPGVLCASWKVFVSTDVKVHTAHWRPGARIVLSITPCEQLPPSVDGLSPFDETLPLFQAWHNSEMSIKWVSYVRSLRCTFRTTCHRSTDVWWGDSGKRLVFVGFRQPMIIRQVSCSVRSVSLHGWSAHTLGKHNL